MRSKELILNHLGQNNEKMWGFVLFFIVSQIRTLVCRLIPLA